MKGLEKGYPIVAFSKRMTETITNKTLKLTSNIKYVNEKFFIINFFVFIL